MNEKIIEEIIDKRVKLPAVCILKEKKEQIKKLLEKYFSDKIILDKKVYDAMVWECTLAAIRRWDFTEVPLPK